MTRIYISYKFFLSIFLFFFLYHSFQGFIYFSYGEGASFQAPDNGEFGDNPCRDDVDYTGAYRAMNPNKYHGKVVKVDPNTLQLTIVTMGHRNPFRLTVWNNQLYESETGWFTYEEVNIINTDVNIPLKQKNYGMFSFEYCFYQIY